MIRYVSNIHVLDDLALEGFKDRARSVNSEPAADEADQPPWANVRRFLQDAFGDCDFHVACDIFLLGKTCAEHGAALQRSAGTACRSIKRLKTRMRTSLFQHMRMPATADSHAALPWLRSFCREMIAQELVENMNDDTTGCLIDLTNLAVSTDTPLPATKILLGERRFPNRVTIKELRTYLKLEESKLFTPTIRWLGAWQDDRAGQYVCGFPRLLASPVHPAIASKKAHQATMKISAAV